MTETILVPKDIGRYERDPEIQAASRKADDECIKAVETLLDEKLPNAWRSYVKVDFVRAGSVWSSATQLAIKNIQSFPERSRVFRKVERNQEFTLSAKHIVTLTEYVNERIAKKQAENDQDAKLKEFRTLLRPVIQTWETDSRQIDNVGLNGIKVVQRDVLPSGSLSFTIDRKGKISNVRVPFPRSVDRYNTTIEELTEHIARCQPHVDVLKLVAERIVAQLPQEYFVKSND